MSVQARNRLPLDLLAACPLIERSGLDVVLHLRADGVAQALGVLLGPAKAPTQEELAPTQRDAVGTQPIGREPAHVALVAQGSQGLSAADQAEQRQSGRRRVGDTGRHHQGPGGQHGDQGGGQGHQRGPELDRRAQQRLDGVAAHCAMPSLEIRTG